MTDEEKLFSKFYNETKVLVKDMDDSQLREHRDGLRQIAFEARARAIAADDEDRERKAKVSKKDWVLSPTHPDATSDAINAVKIRQQRMSKLDKTRKQLLAAGIDEDTVNEMVRGLEKNATEQSLKNTSFPVKPIIDTVIETAKKPNPFAKFQVCPKCKQNPCVCDGPLTPVLA